MSRVGRWRREQGSEDVEGDDPHAVSEGKPRGSKSKHKTKRKKRRRRDAASSESEDRKKRSRDKRAAHSPQLGPALDPEALFLERALAAAAAAAGKDQPG